METYMTAPQVARIFGVKVPTVRRYIVKGELPAARVGRNYVVTKSDVEVFMNLRKDAWDVERIEREAMRQGRRARSRRRR
jgi:excisionase family DNA binding protein